MLKQLRVDSLGLRVWLEKKTRMGKRSHPDNPFGYTCQFLATYSEDTDSSEVIKVLQSEGVTNDFETLRYLLTWDELIPDYEDD